MNIFDKIYKQAKANPKKIVLAEGDDARIIDAAHEVIKSGLAKIVLLGKQERILAKIGARFDSSKLEIIDPQKSDKLASYADDYYNLRKHRGETKESAHDLLLKDPVYYAAMMLRRNDADGFVAGAVYTTSHVARAVLRCIKKDPKYVTASGGFLMEVKDKNYGENGLFLFADCAIVPMPSEEQLADIALSSTEIWSKITGYTPRVAMLSFSSKSSSSHALLEKVKRATELVRKKRPELIIDGELQADSAIVPSVAKIKTPNSSLAGEANILIFPNLDSGNIAYKLLQRLAGARAVGPIMQGVSQPCSDLSRGCNCREIVDAIVVTCIRAQ